MLYEEEGECILGHEDVTTTLKIYHHVIEEQKRDVVTAIDNIFYSNPQNYPNTPAELNHP